MHSEINSSLLRRSLFIKKVHKVKSILNLLVFVLLYGLAWLHCREGNDPKAQPIRNKNTGNNTEQPIAVNHGIHNTENDGLLCRRQTSVKVFFGLFPRKHYISVN